MENNSLARDLIMWMQRIEKDPESIHLEERENILYGSSPAFQEKFVFKISDLANCIENIVKSYQEDFLSIEDYERVCRGFLICDQKLHYSNGDVHAAGMYLFRHILSVYRSIRQKLLTQLLPRMHRIFPLKNESSE